MKAKRMWLPLFLATLLVVLTACSSGNNASTTGAEPSATPDSSEAGSSVADVAQVGEELIILTGTDASTFDPHFCTDSATELFNKNMYSNLVRFNGAMEVQPDLAESWEPSEDGMAWTFKLRQGVKFHDGTDFTSKDVKASFDRILDPDVGSPRRSVLIAISEVEIVDDYTVILHTAYPAGALINQLCHPAAAIISSAALEQYGKDISTHPTGAGAYKFVEWKMGEEIVMERFEDYYGGAPMVQNVYFRIVPEDATRAMLLQSGQADVALWLPVTEVQRLSSDSNIQTIEQNTLMTHYIALNNTKTQLSDVRVRQAMNYAVDKDIIINDILEGQGSVCDAPISKFTWGYSSTMTYPYDLEKAQSLLAEAGYPDGIDLELWTPVGRYLMDIQICENIQAQWAKAGIRVTIRQWEHQALMDEIKKGEFDMVYLGWSPSTGDADQGLYAVFHSTQWVPNSNRALYANDDVDRLLDAARVEIDTATRAEQYKEAQQILMEECPWLFLYWPKQMLMHRSNVEGLELLPTEHLILNNVTKS